MGLVGKTVDGEGELGCWLLHFCGVDKELSPILAGEKRNSIEVDVVAVVSVVEIVDNVWDGEEGSM